MNRRNFMQTTAALAAVPAWADVRPPKVIDANFYLGRWPFRELAGLDAAALQQRGIAQALAGSLDGLFQRDLAQVNARLADACDGKVLLPVGTVQPLLPDWRDDLKRCREVHGMKAIRLHPNYHGYTLADPIFSELLAAATDMKLAVQMVVQLEDERTQHPLVQVKPVDLKPLPEVLRNQAQARVMLLNANATMVVTALRGCKNLWMDFAMIEGVGGVENLLKTWPLDKVCFGTYAPVFYPESSLLKMQESELSTTQQVALTEGNVTVFLG